MEVEAAGSEVNPQTLAMAALMMKQPQAQQPQDSEAKKFLALFWHLARQQQQQQLSLEQAGNSSKVRNAIVVSELCADMLEKGRKITQFASAHVLAIAEIL